MGVILQRGELHPQGYRAADVAPPPARAGRYRVTFGGVRGVSALPSSQACRCAEPQGPALVWLTFMEAGRETGRELTDMVCSRCEPERFRRVQQWAGVQPAGSARGLNH